MDSLRFLLAMVIGSLGIVFLMGVVVGVVFRGYAPASTARRGVAMPTAEDPVNAYLRQRHKGFFN